MPFFHVDMEHGDILICHVVKEKMGETLPRDDERKYLQFNENASGEEIKALFGSIGTIEGVYRKMPVIAPTSRIISMRGTLGSTIFPTKGTIWPDEAPTL